MKTKLILLFVVFLPFISSAQHTTIGPELSFLLSNNSEFEFSSFNNKRASFSYGVNFARQLSNKIYLETGFQYLTQGAKYETCYTFPEGEPNKIVVKRDYVIVPLNVLYGIGPNNNIKGTLGLFGAYNVKAIQDYPEPIGGCNIGHPRDLTNNTEQFYLGLLTGLSYVVFSNEILEIELGLEYYKNLTQINNFVNNNSIGLSSKFNLKL